MFKSGYLLKLLRSPDSLTGNQAPSSKNLFKNLAKPAEKKVNLVPDTPKPSTETVKELMEKKGNSIIKKKLCQFYRQVHIISERSFIPSNELISDITHLVGMENKRLESINPSENLHRYLEYVMEGFLPLITDYIKRVLQ